MANILGKIKNMFSADEYEEFEEGLDGEEIEDEEAEETSSSRTNNVTNIDQYSPERYSPKRYSASQFSSRARNYNVNNVNQRVEVVIAAPSDLEDAGNICIDLRSKKATVVNLENVDYEMAQRISDFLSGSAYALEAKIQSISDMIFIIGPVNFDITGEFRDELRANGIKIQSWR